jgi:cellulase/cellobiase CelA1
MQKNIVLLFVIILSVVFFGMTQAIAAENPLVEEGISQYRQENYDEALSVLKKARPYL